MQERISTGVPGLDKLIEGGFPKGSVTLLTGGPGAGKTIFCSQFLYHGLKKGEKCLYITTEELPGDILADTRQFGMDFEQYQDQVEMRYIPPAQKVIGEIEWIIKEKDFDRIVLDSLSVFEMYKGEDEGTIRRYINELFKKFRETDATVLVTSEIADGASEKLSRYGVAEFVADAVVKMNGLSLGESNFRTAQIVKMRRTDIDGGVVNVEIDGDGLAIREQEKL